MGLYSNHLSASIMCADQMNLNDEITRLLDAGINRLHCDVMDGVFVDNLAMGPYDIVALNGNKELILDVHLATVNPEKYIHMFGPLKPEYITFHIEATDDVTKCIELIKSYNVKPGIAYSPSTSNDAILPYLEDIELLLAMTVPPGFSGQKFCYSVINKLENLFDSSQKLGIRIPSVSVDGNIYDETIQQMSNLPIDFYVLGTSALFDGEVNNYDKKAKRLESIIKQGY